MLNDNSSPTFGLGLLHLIIDWLCDKSMFGPNNAKSQVANGCSGELSIESKELPAKSEPVSQIST